MTKVKRLHLFLSSSERLRIPSVNTISSFLSVVILPVIESGHPDSNRKPVVRSAGFACTHGGHSAVPSKARDRKRSLRLRRQLCQLRYVPAVRLVGVEPTVYGLKARCHNLLATDANRLFCHPFAFSPNHFLHHCFSLLVR